MAIVASTLLLGCPGTPADDPTDGGTDPGADGGTTEPPAGPVIDQTEQLGAFLPSPAGAVLLGMNSPIAFVGTTGAVMDPSHFGMEGDRVMVTGLAALDRDTGKVRVYTDADGLPTFTHSDPFESYGTVTAPIFDMEWLETDRRFVAAGWEHLIIGTVDDAGAWSFENTPLRDPGASENAHLGHVEVAGGLVYVGTDQGLAVVDPADTSSATWIDLGETRPWVSDLAVGRFGSELEQLRVAVLYGPADAPPLFLASVGTDETVATRHAFDTLLKPTSLLGLVDRILVGFQVGNLVAGEIHALEPDLDGWTLRRAVQPQGLTTPAWGMVVPNVMAHEPGRIIVGGKVVKGEPGGPGGGLVTLSYQNGHFGAEAQDLIDRRDPYNRLLPWNYDVLEIDEYNNIWAVGSTLCSGSKRRALPLVRIERSDQPKLVRPWVPGVRAIAVDPVEGGTWVSTRIENPGLSCDGLPLDSSLCRLRGDGACEIYTPFVNSNADVFAPAPSAVEVAFGDPDRKELALATLRAALFLRTDETTRAVATQFDPHLSLRHTAAAWGGPGELWVSSVVEWEDRFEEEVNARGPQGLGRIVLDETGAPIETRRYTRLATDEYPDDVSGLPSSMVWDVESLDDGRVVAALGVERKSWSYDHYFPPAVDNGSAAGVAFIDDTEVTAVEAPEDAPFQDVVALARTASGTLLALDAVMGVYSVDPETHAASLWLEALWPQGERGLSIATDGAGRVAIGTSEGAWIVGQDGGVTRVADAGTTGWVWDVHFVSEGVLYVGGDRGLLRTAVEGTELPERGPARGFSRWLWSLDRGCYGAEGCACTGPSQCAPENACVCATPTDCECQPQDPCVADPGSEGCSCNMGELGACDDGLECTEDLAGGKATCEVPTCGGVAGCACVEHTDCADGYHCEFVMGRGMCTAGDACLSGCTCTGEGTTADGCQEGYECRSVGGGQTTCEEIRCEADCSCTGPDATADGCPTGFTCQSDPFGGQVCVQKTCEDDCSCTGPGVNPDGCPTGTACESTLDGQQCVAQACEDDCSCTGPGFTPEGCPMDWTCETGPMGQTCVEPACMSDCSCTGDGIFEGCPLGYACITGPLGNSSCEAAPPPAP